MGHHQNGCGCCCSGQSAGQCCGSAGSHEHHCDSEHEHAEETCHKLLDIADQAWMEVLKEKIKDHIRTNDRKIDEMAKIISEANHERWQRKMAKKRACEEYKEKLKGLFCSGESCQSGKASKDAKW